VRRQGFPGAAQHDSDALQNRDRRALGVWNDPGSAAHRFTLRRIRETGHLYDSHPRGAKRSSMLSHLS